MSASTLAQSAVRIRYSPLLVLVIALASFSAGIGFVRLAPSTSAVTAPVTQPFNAVLFREEERNAGNSIVVFDAAKFRADEHALR